MTKKNMKIINKHINREYLILDKFEAGISLTGSEVKSIRQGRISFVGAFVKFVSGSPVLVGAQIFPYQFNGNLDYDDKRTRKLLLHKKEILRLTNRLSERPNLTIVPVSCYTKGSLIKLEIALVQGKKTWEKKKTEKNKAETRRVEKEIKEELKG